jgi:hypothetical protein
MRTLHTVAAHEKFVASGEYRYFRDEQPMKVVEKWTIHELQGGARLIRVDEDGRDEDGLTILSEALVSPEGEIERYNVQSFNSHDPQVKNFKADYIFEKDLVQIGRSLQGQEREYIEFPLVVDCLLYIKQTLFMGSTIRQILAKGGKSQVFTPQLTSVDDSHLLKMIVEERGTEVVNISRKDVQAAKFQIADDVFYWLDNRNIPVQRTYTHDGQTYRAVLSNYAHR